MKKTVLFVLTCSFLSFSFGQYTELRVDGIPLSNPGNFLEHKGEIYFTANLFDRSDEFGLYKIDTATKSIKLISDFLGQPNISGGPGISIFSSTGTPDALISLNGILYVGIQENERSFECRNNGSGLGFHLIGTGTRTTIVGFCPDFILSAGSFIQDESGRLIITEDRGGAEGLQLYYFGGEMLTNDPGQFNSISNLYFHNQELFFEAIDSTATRRLHSVDSISNLKTIDYDFIPNLQESVLSYASSGEKLLIFERRFFFEEYKLSSLLNNQIKGIELPNDWVVDRDNTFFSLNEDIFITRFDSDASVAPSFLVLSILDAENNFQVTDNLSLAEYYNDDSFDSRLIPLTKSTQDSYILGLGIIDGFNFSFSVSVLDIRYFLIRLREDNGAYSLEKMEISPQDKLAFLDLVEWPDIEAISSGSFEYIGANVLFTNSLNPIAIGNNLDITVNNPLCPGANEKGSISLVNQTFWDLEITVSNSSIFPRIFTLKGRNKDQSFNSFEVVDLDIGNYTISAELTPAADTEFRSSGLDPSLLPKFLSANPFKTSINNEELLSLTGKTIDRNLKAGIFEIRGSDTYTVQVNDKEYNYAFSDNVNHFLEVPLEQGRNRIKISSDMPCKGSLSTTIDIDPVIVYPNPSVSLTKLDFFENSENIEMFLSNMNGAKVYQKKFKGIQKSVSIDVSSLPPGVYFGQIRGQSSNYPFKILVKK